MSAVVSGSERTEPRGSVLDKKARHCCALATSIAKVSERPSGASRGTAEPRALNVVLIAEPSLCASNSKCCARDLAGRERDCPLPPAAVARRQTDVLLDQIFVAISQETESFAGE
jgi:hypothetical protein